MGVRLIHTVRIVVDPGFFERRRDRPLRFLALAQGWQTIFNLLRKPLCQRSASVTPENTTHDAERSPGLRDGLWGVIGASQSEALDGSLPRQGNRFGLGIRFRGLSSMTRI